MTANNMPNFFLTTLAQSLSSGGSETEVFVSSITTLDGTVIQTSDFAEWGRGVLTIDPQSTSRTEFVSFTGVDSSGIGFTGATRGLSFNSNSSVSGNKHFHPVGAQVIISFGTHNILDIISTFAAVASAETVSGLWTFTTSPIVPDPTTAHQAASKEYVDNTAVAGAPNASTTVKGIVQEATPAQVLAKTASGSTGAELYVSPSTLASTLLSDYVVDTGSANAYVITPSPAITAYTTGQIFSFKAVNANTTASTVNVNGLGTKNIYKLGGTPLVSGDISAGRIVLIEYDGTEFQMLSPVSNVPVIPPVTDIETFTSVGTNTWTMPTSAKKVFVQMWGAGGSGGVSSNIDSAGGGGGGEYWEQWFAASDLTSSVTVTIGAGGSSVGNPNNGNVGGNTTFGSFATAHGGGGGGTNGSGTSTGGSGGAPTSVSVATLWGVGAAGAVGGYGLYSGAGAGNGNTGGASYYGGAGGGGSTSSGTTVGGVSIYGGNGGGGTFNVTATAGSQPGGGGGASGSGNSGKGGDGKAIITTFF